MNNSAYLRSAILLIAVSAAGAASAAPFSDLFDLSTPSPLYTSNSDYSTVSSGWQTIAPDVERNVTLTPQNFNTDEYGTTFYAVSGVDSGILDAVFFGAQAKIDVDYRFAAPVDLSALPELRFDIGTLGGTSLQAYAADSFGNVNWVTVGAGGQTSGLLTGVVAGQVTAIGFRLAAPSELTDYSAYLNGVQAVPEPASIAALGLGALSLLRRRRRS